MMMNRGFTLVELVVSIAIFAAMTALVVVKYGNFNQSTLFTDTAYDIALVIHTAQTYGLSVKNTSSSFSAAYGVDFYDVATGSVFCGSASTNNASIVLFADTAPQPTPNQYCDGNDSNVTTYAISRGATVTGLCVGTALNSCNSVSRLDVTYLRPNPEATICGYNGSTWTCTYTYGKVTLTATDSSTRSIEMRQNGEVSVLAQ